MADTHESSGQVFPYSVLYNVEALLKWKDELGISKATLEAMRDPTGKHNLLISAVAACLGEDYCRVLLSSLQLDPNALAGGYSALYYAVSLDDWPATQLLLEHGASFAGFVAEETRLRDEVVHTIGAACTYLCAERSLFHVCVESCNESAPSLMQRIIELLPILPRPQPSLDSLASIASVILASKDRSGLTALDYAFMYGKFRSLSWLVGFLTKHLPEAVKDLEDMPYKTHLKASGDEQEARAVLKAYWQSSICDRISTADAAGSTGMPAEKLLSSETFNVIPKDGNLGVIRQAQIISQLDDEFIQLARKEGVNEGICGFVVSGIANFFTHSKCDWDSANLSGMERAVQQLHDTEMMTSLITDSMRWVSQDRDKYLVKHEAEFADDYARKWYRKDWVANYEISDYIQVGGTTREHTSAIKPRKVVFVRRNQLGELSDAKHEEKKRILLEEAPFGLEEQYLVEFFHPERQLVAGSKLRGGAALLELLNESQVLFILDLNGHYNVALTSVLDGRINLVLLDTLPRTSQCCNPIVLFLFDCLCRAVVKAS